MFVRDDRAGPPSTGNGTRSALPESRTGGSRRFAHGGHLHPTVVVDVRAPPTYLRRVERPHGRIKASPADFVVDEIPAYLPSGEGPHLYVHFRKTNRTTDDVVRELTKALKVDRRDAGVAGMKDKVGITTQWVSVPAKDPSVDAKLATLEMEGVELLAHARHGNKLKTGHLQGNRFTVVVRDIERSALPTITETLARIAADGVPNAFGAQRFGRDNDNHVRARSWMTGQSHPPGDPRLRRLHFSALQSAIFNAVLNERVALGTWNVPMLGDLLQKEAEDLRSGGIFVCTDVQLDHERALRGELGPTGPILGDKMRRPEADALALEERIAAPFIEGIDLHRARSLGEGTRRALRLRVQDIDHVCDDASSIDEVHPGELSSDPSTPCAMTLRFVLPKGAYATTVLDNVFTTHQVAGREKPVDEKTEEE